MTAVTAIEIALDLETLQIPDRSAYGFSGPDEPRICLVAAFALTSHLKRIIAAVDRAIPMRLHGGFRAVPSPVRSISAAPVTVSVEPMLVLSRLQSKFIRAIEPGLTHDEDTILFASVHDMGEAPERFIRDFIHSKTLPVFEPQRVAPSFEALQLRASGITIFHLGSRGAPESILAHWAYAQDSRGSLHLKSGP
jgi:hypothetical protein